MVTETVNSLSDRRPVIIAHRGFQARYPENTLVSFQAAVEAGADVIEMDVNLSLGTMNPSGKSPNLAFNFICALHCSPKIILCLLCDPTFSTAAECQGQADCHFGGYSPATV